jgi:protein phosphatase PTC2/3
MIIASLSQYPFHQANAGDSRSVLSVMGEVKPLSFDHKPSNESSFELAFFSVDHLTECYMILVERHRINAAGGFVDFGRVNGTGANCCHCLRYEFTSFVAGNLALSRALGDFDFKKNPSMDPEKQIITADPDVTVHDITEEDEFLVIACDGELFQRRQSICV